MEKGTTYYSINGRRTKKAIKENIAELLEEINGYENAKQTIYNLCMVKSDHETITAILDKYIFKRKERISDLKNEL